MIVTLVGVVITILFILVIKGAIESGVYQRDTIGDDQIMPITFLALGIVIIAASLFCATKYRDAKFIEEVKLSHYSYSSKDFNFQYQTWENSEMEGTKSIHLHEIKAKRENVNIMERKDITVPTLKRYVMKGKISIWTLGIFDEKKVYELYVPSGTFSDNTNY